MLPPLSSTLAGQASPAILALADGTLFRGVSIGAPGQCSGPMVVNTLMTGHQEIMTDSAYAGQILALTYPHVGSTGVNPHDSSSSGSRINGLVIRDCPAVMSNFRATQSLPDYLVEQGIVAISGIDTRQLARHVRDHGTQQACILVGDDAQEALSVARAESEQQHDAQSVSFDAVSVTKQQSWSQGVVPLAGGDATRTPSGIHVVVYDLGVKYGLLRELADRDCRVTLVPASATAADILALQPDGIVLSSGPTLPQAHTTLVSTSQDLLAARVPIMAVGLGLQLVAQALGASLVRHKTGRHGGNHPVQHLPSGRVLITSQHYDMAVQQETLPDNVHVTHMSLFDGTVQGFELTDAPVQCFMGYPEGSPGPRDAAPLINSFLDLMAANR